MISTLAFITPPEEEGTKRDSTDILLTYPVELTE
jgi:hypothetical protein